MIRRIFHLLTRFFSYFIIGLNIDGKKILPKKGPAIIVANHNSHLDAIILSSLYRVRYINNVRSVGAADYFFKNKFTTFLSKNLMGIIPIARRTRDRSIFDEIYTNLDNEKIIILFPEGSRGKPGKMRPLKNGVSRIAKAYPHVPIYPVRLGGTGKILGKDEFVLVPFVVKVDIMPPEYYNGSRKDLMEKLTSVLSYEEVEEDEVEEDLDL